jgi:hypothetical protein
MTNEEPKKKVKDEEVTDEEIGINTVINSLRLRFQVIGTLTAIGAFFGGFFFFILVQPIYLPLHTFVAFLSFIGMLLGIWIAYV